ncbi:MAG: MoaD/ThiS family protein [Syntrophorhabdales bacterium]|jgi:molybdopterin converting factor small subunit
MEVEVKLFGTMGHFLPEGGERFSFKRSLAEGTTAGHLLKDLGVPPEMAVLAIVNGRQVGLDHVLKDRDDVAFFSPAAGG